VARHGQSLQSASMGRFARILGRFERVLELAEEQLRLRRVGRYGPDFFQRSLAFRWEESRDPASGGRLIAIESPSLFELDDLVGVDQNLAKLVRNTEQHLRGLPANNVLLYGERGTGKSSAVKGLLARFGGQGLRLVEVQREDLAHLPAVLAALRGAEPNYRFMVFCDDLSFGADESGFRELKAALEGSLEAPPENVCIVATSNRRHLLPETMADNRAAGVDDQNELHLGEALEEKLALADRFGLVLGFYACTQSTYLEIVSHWLRDGGLNELDELAREAALRYALERGGRSGRIARQFANEWIGRTRLAETPSARR